MPIYDGNLESSIKTKIDNLSGTNSGDQNLFQTIAVSGQSNVVADSTTDTLTLVAGSNMTITTDASTDTITFASSSGGGETTSSLGTLYDSASAETAPADGDFFTFADISASNILKKITWANIKATLKTYFDTLYITKNTWTTFSPTLTAGTGSITAYTINTARYKIIDDLCYIDVIFTLTTAGTASNYLKLGEMPKKFNAGRSVILNGREYQNSGLPIQGCAIAPDTATDKYLLIRTMTNTYRGSSGDIFSLQGFYPVHPDDL